MTSTTITIKVSGSLLTPEGITTLAHALHDAPSAYEILLVHGGGPQITDALERHDAPIRYHDGLRVTTRDQANIAQATMDQTGSHLAKQLDHYGHPTEHVSSIEQRLLAKRKPSPQGAALGRVGTPLSFRTHRLPLDERIPVITPVGTDATGPLNVNADEAAAHIAHATDSDRLLMVTNVPGVLDEHGTPIETLNPAKAETLIEDGTAAGGMRPKLHAAKKALQNGVRSVDVTPLTRDLLAPTGTRITNEPEVPA